MASVSESANPEVSILLLDDSGITGLNERYLERTGPTDVISFPMHDAEELSQVQPDLLGDVVISVETAARQAERYGCSRWEELTRLLAHGILHLLGYDHEQDPAGARKMRARERKAVAAVLADERISAAVAGACAARRPSANKQ